MFKGKAAFPMVIDHSVLDIGYSLTSAVEVLRR